MAMVQVEIDDKLLEQASRVLDTTSVEETIDAALREVAGRASKIEAWAGLRAMAERGDFDVLLDKRNYRR